MKPRKYTWDKGNYMYYLCVCVCVCNTHTSTSRVNTKAGTKIAWKFKIHSKMVSLLK